MTSVGDSVKRAFKTATSTAKVVDLDRDTMDSAAFSGNTLTTDHGVKVSDTDNWFVP